VRLGQSEITDIFAPGGKLSRGIPHYESRPQQGEFARQVLEVLTNGGGLVIEAATGVGKSIGYLVPSIAVSILRESPVIISTNTKNLQEQLIEKDLPVVRKVMGQNFTAAALKGRGNYLCLRKWELLLGGRGDEKTREFVDHVSSRLRGSSSGDLAEAASSISYSLWEQVASDPSTCLSIACPYVGKCYWRKARRKASQANVVIVNHSLLFSDVGCERTLLPEHDTVIMDEAHNVERVATEHFGVEVSGARIRKEAEKLLSAGGLLASVRKRLRRRLPKVRRLAISSRMQEVERTVEGFLGVSERAFARLPQLLGERSAHGTVRYGDEMTSLPGEFEETGYACSRIEDSLEALRSSVKESSELLEDAEDVLIEISGAVERWRGLASDVMFLWEASRPEFVFWIDQRQREEPAVKACPVWVRDEMRDSIFSHLRSLVLTSATMAVAGRLDHFTFRLGLEGEYEPRCAVVDSPFDYSRQVTVTVPNDFADPRHAEFTPAVGRLLMNLLDAAPRKTLVLFTAYDMLRQVYDSVTRSVEEKGFTVLGQGVNGSRFELIESFKSSRKAVLLGTSSFWEGIDLPGEDLELLVLARLPFSVPEDPIVQARSESLLANGREPFTDYLLPEAVVRLRQGFGRLIRRKTDRGAVVILDPRIARASYGPVFEESLPAPVRPCPAEEIPKRISEWFGGTGAAPKKARSRRPVGKRG
jgi:ATP-dependent DNA helicase DinG